MVGICLADGIFYLARGELPRFETGLHGGASGHCGGIFAGSLSVVFWVCGFVVIGVRSMMV